MNDHTKSSECNLMWTINTDGACKFNPGAGGWAYSLTSPCGVTVEASGGCPDSTNNRMEMTAVIEAIKALAEGATAVLSTDSQLVQMGCSIWMPKWKSNGWRKADNKPVLNQDLWRELDDLLQTRSVRFVWVRGHAGHAGNERVDYLATAAAEAQHQRLS